MRNNLVVLSNWKLRLLNKKMEIVLSTMSNTPPAARSDIEDYFYKYLLPNCQ